VAHVFAVQNTGTIDLKISNLVTSCGCTTAELSSRVIPPGQRADLIVTYDPDFHTAEGPVVRLVWFATNDPAQPWAEVRITADVR
jgi:alpha-D-ribose 1-methylphosphonate 5-triphosphate diphosphatase PhnM